MGKLKILILLFLSSYAMAGTIRIAVAANVSYAINDLKKEFNNIYPDIKVEVILGSSGKLTAQIKNGAPYQLFMSANMAYPNMLYKEHISTTKPLVYAQGVLAMLSVKETDFKDGIFTLNSKSIKKIAIANNRTAPYGVAAKEALESAKIYKKLKHKFVYAESISQTVSYTMHGADIGLIAKSSLFSPQMAHYKENIHWIEVDTSLYSPIEQGVVLLKNRNVEVDAFYNFMLGQKAKSILEKYGYTIPKLLHGK